MPCQLTELHHVHNRVILSSSYLGSIRPCSCSSLLEHWYALHPALLACSAVAADYTPSPGEGVCGPWTLWGMPCWTPKYTFQTFCPPLAGPRFAPQALPRQCLC